MRPLDTPFDIPDSWEWIRFKDLVDYSMGKTPPRKETEYWSNGTLPWVSIADLVADGTVTETKECVNDYAAEHTFKLKISKAGTLLMSFKLTVGKVSILGIDAFHNEAIISIYPFVDPDRITTMFLFALLPLLSQSGDTKSAIKGNTLNSDSLDALLIPLPPIQEQKRIFEKLQELIAPLNDYGVAEQKASELNASFPEALKKSILQEAVQGKLVPQDPSDEPAEALLERIRTEKQRLIKEGKIKKDKHESVIFRRDNSHYEKLDGVERCIDDELPFEIPENWCWVHFSDIAIFENGDRSSKYPVESDYVQDGIPFFGAKDMGERFMEYSSVRFITPQKFEELGNGKLKNGDFVCLLRGNVGKTRIFKESPKYHTGFICAQMLIVRCLESNIREFVYTVINSPYYCRAIESKITGTAVRQLPAKEVANLLIPLPPLKEQLHIVKQIEQILPLITVT